MNIRTLVSRTARNLSGKDHRRQSAKKTQGFEANVCSQIFTEENYTLLEDSYERDARQHTSSRHFLDPGFQMVDKKTGQTFWLESKYRSEEYGGKVNWCTEEQLNHYKICHRKIPVFILLGIGGGPAVPDHLYLLSLAQARSTALVDSFVKKFEISPGRPIGSNLLWRD